LNADVTNGTNAQKAESARDTKEVVAYTLKVMYQKKDTSTADYLKTVCYNDAEISDIQRWALSHSNNSDHAELVIYKLNANGTVEVVINWADRFDASSAAVTDVMAKVSDFR
ncbi:MAG: hypothetical protein II370_09485, partial [Clostridia bacterium]|nr:hypothetical protein [Clostridia bacterium]